MAMNLLDMIMSAQNGATAEQAGAQLGLNQQQSQSAIAALLPAISSALKQNTANPQGLAGLLGALQNGQHEKYLENPQMLGEPQTVNDGNAILGHLFGSKDVSRAVAGRASAQTGIGSDVLKKLLPLVATMAMGSLSKQTKQPTMQSALTGLAMQHLMGGQKKSGLGAILGAVTGANSRQQRQTQQTHQQGMGILGKLLDADGDGSMMDDVLQMAMNARR
ncbi:DUF937 domain-containing protein [Hellea balneolensis]|uniref:DUF937 domain-containing protein n=1 Tax=Hellea balneolensis TaxID=287478 RepID=UPI000409291A|nr:DUF937 domain-containing protein [Hellea balneolensis]